MPELAFTRYFGFAYYSCTWLFKQWKVFHIHGKLLFLRSVKSSNEQKFALQTKINYFFLISPLPFPRIIFNLRQCLSNLNFLKMYASSYKCDVEP